MMARLGLVVSNIGCVQTFRGQGTGTIADIAPGPAGIPTEVLKELAELRRSKLLNLYNHCPVIVQANVHAKQCWKSIRETLALRVFAVQ